MEHTGVIIVAGGGGERMGTSLPKQFLLIGGAPILARTINTFAHALPGAPIVVVLPAARIDFWRNLSARFEVAAHTVVTGGDTRTDSVRNGLAALPDDVELIAVHDGVRPLVSRELILRTVAAAAQYGAAIPVVEPVDSFRTTESIHSPATASNEQVITSHAIDRSRLRAVQTPQIFRAELLRRAYASCDSTGCTDDASLVERFGQPVSLCEGERRNIKITTPDDLHYAEAILQASAEEESEADALRSNDAATTDSCCCTEASIAKRYAEAARIRQNAAHPTDSTPRHVTDNSPEKRAINPLGLLPDGTMQQETDGATQQEPDSEHSEFSI